MKYCIRVTKIAWKILPVEDFAFQIAIILIGLRWRLNNISIAIRHAEFCFKK